MSNKNWKVLPRIEQNFIEKYPQYNEIILQLLWNRGLKEKEEIREFLEFDFVKNIHDPFLFQDMETAVELIIVHIKKGNKITVYGDYDADGVTSSVLLSEVLQTLKAKTEIYIPDRVSEGYGLNKEAIDYIDTTNTKLIITVDGGIRNKEIVEYIQKKNIEIIVTDHHIPPEEKNEYPECLIINPSVPDEKYPFKYLAGVGVAFKLASAIIQKSKLNEDDKKLLQEKVLDLVALGTVADCVKLFGENRTLVKRGLEILNKTKRIGIKELIKASSLENRNLDSWNIGFQLAPRINAAGRMAHANTAVELLSISDKKEAEVLAKRLNARNMDRQKETEEIVEEIQEKIEKKLKDKILICVNEKEKDHWNEGLIGLVAGRICEKYHRPALVITRTMGGYKGSGRSIINFDLIEAVEESSEFLDKYGGHPMACGFSLNIDRINDFKNKIKGVANEKLGDEDLKPMVIIDKEIPLEEIGEDLLADIKLFEPFGQGNLNPKFLSRNVIIVNIFYMGLDGQHIKLILKNEKSGIINAVGFNQTEKLHNLSIGDKIDIVYYVDMNEYNGKSEVQMKIVDIKVFSM
ncbi:single-stranded-DNA-specific exonuclease RecJ [Candidatus Falkowbacteria bacterium RIFOXYB2_FULL_34_18]|uniref:Single-stranded-DNA-specific exonuclease RecJ n=1 Tax=Candidatus Falkowbacteria bacterium RIFOXYD2_FULL_34_120 TaxID=1798007 RepID=A0A1F5TPZ9_9BACT|nr:MAG: single-stranded-DNA-specific exonuclease RecJ [Candidatus Falkowbacteria bacterium RIFOXYB2_FULL_34_18]OGF29303.1 MAG: single-stranded-DNA-specific exonuclease RecJ [Candidatus Falkowbacteria bacterium RIFOXYC12_FULL_34_55]OGF36419.1 MAG: single-stranded-DNA-specific exonuclease RecJ [Candidatus Falkowbacteria bacterium RIFOXYC2_FULL_34_220]OGF38898.1 MAG: single-stranded-DNA-specific exonuclease RecJ [Candidatus Falkowbacteria bacterium RIFOXYD12_FULL_34_57]OGF40917.1 MAG: single-stran